MVHAVRRDVEQVDEAEPQCDHSEQTHERTQGARNDRSDDQEGTEADLAQTADLDRIVDRAWDPPVTLGVRLVSVIADNLQHVGQAAFVRGMLLRA
jgi:hypothetical protein